MKFKIDDKIFEKFPELNIGIIVTNGIDNKGSVDDIHKLMKEKEGGIRSNFNIETLSQNPKIEAWRKAYSIFGAKPKKYHCCAENLYRMILGGIELKSINKLVDIYTYILIKYMIPLGGDDLDKIDGDIILKFAKGDEPFTELNKGEVTNPKEGEIVYADDKEILCRRWNWRECDKSKMTEDTKNAILVVEGLPPVTNDDVESVITELGELVEKFCGGEIRKYVLNRNNPELEF